VTINYGNDVRESNSTRHPLSRDTPELERRTQAMPAVQVANPAAESVEININIMDY